MPPPHSPKMYSGWRQHNEVFISALSGPLFTCIGLSEAKQACLLRFCAPCPNNKGLTAYSHAKRFVLSCWSPSQSRYICNIDSKALFSKCPAVQSHGPLRRRWLWNSETYEAHAGLSLEQQTFRDYAVKVVRLWLQIYVGVMRADLAG